MRTISELPRDERRRRTRTLFDQARRATEPRRVQLLSDVVLANLPVARSIARRYVGRGIPAEDLEQVAYVALVRAVHRFQADRSEDFLTFAVPTIRGELKRWFRDHGWMVRPPRPVQELQASIQKVRAEATEELDDATVAARLGCTEAEVREAQAARGCFTPSSLDAPVGDGDSGLVLGDTLASGEDHLDRTELRFMLTEALKTLTPPIFLAIVEEAHKLNLPVGAHNVTLANAKLLMKAGVEGWLHLPVRMGEVPDDELLGIIRDRIARSDRPKMWFNPGAGTGAATREDWNDPLLRDTISPAQIQAQVGEQLARITPQSVERARQNLKTMGANNALKLRAAGMKIVNGSDTGQTRCRDGGRPLCSLEPFPGPS